MVATYAPPELSAIALWSETLDALHQRIAHRFARVEVRERVRRDLVGLLDRVERKNGWQLAEAIGEFGAKGVQRLLNAATWDADDVREDLRAYVIDQLGDEASGILIVDETGFLKKGTKSCGVARQYTGTAGDTVNCQVGVFLAYASAHGAAFIDRALYLPREWAKTPERHTAAGIPAGTRFASKITLAERMLARAFAADVPARWVVADSFYGRSGPFRRWLEEHDQPYAVMISRTNAVDYRGRRIRVEQITELLADADASPWLCLTLAEECAVGMRHWLLIHGDADDPRDDRYWLPTAQQRRARRSWCGCAIPVGRWRSASRRRKERSAWTSTRCGRGPHGTASSPSACWHMPSWSSFAKLLAATRSRKRGR